MRTHITGRTGRLGSVLVALFAARGDQITGPDHGGVELYGIHYLIFAHRYRNKNSKPDHDREMQVNVGQVIETIEKSTFCYGEDCAIVIVSSVSATDPAMNQSLAYNLSKAAQNQVARYYAKALKGVRVNTVSPNTFTGDKSVITPQQVANVVSFLCSPAASGINGQDVRVG